MTCRELSLCPEVTAKHTSNESIELDYLAIVLDSILVEMRERGDPRADAWNFEALKVQLATAVFRCAADGERDFDALKYGALAAIPPISRFWPIETDQLPGDPTVSMIGRRVSRPSPRHDIQVADMKTRAARPVTRLFRVV